MTTGEVSRLSRARRSRAAAALLFSVILILAAAFFRLQVLGGGAYEL
jgi:hypothetical protein